MLRDHAESAFPNDRLIAVHTCFSALYEGDGEEARRRFPADVFEEAEAMLARHAELERHVGAANPKTPSLPNVSLDAAHEAETHGELEVPSRDPVGRGRPGTLLVGCMAGAFRIDGFLGRGATGEVYLATQLTPTRAVAFKLLLDDFIGGAGLTREAELLASLEHPSIARLYQTGTIAAGGAERRYLAMQFVPGGRTLAEWASEAHDDATCVRMVIAIAEAVAFAHGRGVIHRDLKPRNILVDPSGAPVLIDFGIARLLRADPAQTLHVLGARVQGTLAYAAPEALDPASRPDVRADIFALGAILYELLARRAFRTFRSSLLTGMMAETIGTASPRRRRRRIPRSDTQAHRSSLRISDAILPANRCSLNSNRRASGSSARCVGIGAWSRSARSSRASLSRRQASPSPLHAPRDMRRDSQTSARPRAPSMQATSCLSSSMPRRSAQTTDRSSVRSSSARSVYTERRSPRAIGTLSYTQAQQPCSPLAIHQARKMARSSRDSSGKALWTPRCAAHPCAGTACGRSRRTRR